MTRSYECVNHYHKVAAKGKKVKLTFLSLKKLENRNGIL